MKIRKPDPVAVLISDIHYNLQTVGLADAALNMAVEKANSLGVVLIVAGDMHDSKANVRGECISAIRTTLKKAKTRPFVIVANHDRINEKAPAHSLTFLEDLVSLVEGLGYTQVADSYLLPYWHDVEELKAHINTIPKGARLIMHQGCEGSRSGDYIQDKTALSPHDVADFRVISGHYHTRQDIKCGRPRKGAVGLWSYIGNPYTLTYAESQDPPKGFQVLYSDGTLQFVPTNLRRHVVYETDASPERLMDCPTTSHADLLWIKISGKRSNIQSISRDDISRIIGHASFRLELIPTDEDVRPEQITATTKDATLDALIDSTGVDTTRAERLKALWRGL